MVGVQLRNSEACCFFWLFEGFVALYTPCILVTLCPFNNISCFTYQKKYIFNIHHVPPMYCVYELWYVDVLS